jgi:hypothetical protein
MGTDASASSNVTVPEAFHDARLDRPIFGKTPDLVGEMSHGREHDIELAPTSFRHQRDRVPERRHEATDLGAAAPGQYNEIYR